MTDKKLTDSEIIKALECCSKGVNRQVCEECAFRNSENKININCFNLEKYALDLINRQNAENERLKAYYKDEFERLTITYIQLLEKKTQEIKAEAYKEFAEQVHTEIEEALKSNYKAKGERLEKHNVGDSTDFISYCEGKISALRGIDDFCDNLLKELVGDSDAE